MLTYNGLLYTRRKELNLTRIGMSKLLNINVFTYSMIENGYFKPSKKNVEKISKVLDIDYSVYLNNEPSYPAELPEKEQNKVTKFLYKVLGNWIFKGFVIAFTLASAAFMISGFCVTNDIENHIRSYYPTNYIAFVDKLRENGTARFSVSSTFMSPEYHNYEVETFDNSSKYISVVGSKDDYSLSDMKYECIYRNDNHRLIYSITSSSFDEETNSVKHTINFNLLVYDTNYKYSGFIYKDEKQALFNDTFTCLDDKGDKFIIVSDNAEYKDIVDVILSKINVFEDDINYVIKDHDPESNYTLKTLEYDRSVAIRNLFSKKLYSFLGKYLGIVLTGFGSFVLIFAFLYGTTKNTPKVYRVAQLDIPLDSTKPMKTDRRIIPFIPETLLEVIGILLVFLGSLRFLIYTIGFFYGGFTEIKSSGIFNDLTQVFIVGMFLLYFIDFDVFLEDKRVFRNIAMYSIIFVCLWALENLLYVQLADDSIIGELSKVLKLPNMFGSIACYYMIMCFLFYKPKFVNKYYKLVIYRSLSIIPVGIIVSSWLIYNGNGVFYESTLSKDILTLFSGEKVPFSVLAISYLFGLYFLRLFYEKKYGVDRANIYFNGNRFIWTKNIMVTLLILIIGIFEIILSNNPDAVRLGLGSYPNILFLIPLLLFYMPHKGPRNIILDWATTLLYVGSLGLSYILIVLVAVVNLI